MTHYSDVDAICPFYKGISENNKYSWITCDGIITGTVTKSQFKSIKKRDAHKQAFCDKFCYEQCPVYEAINEKYK